MQDINISLIQLDTIWQNPAQNLEQLEGIIDHLQKPTDIIILPEMFSTGFTMDSRKMAEPMGGRVNQWLFTQAKKLNSALCGSIIIEAAGKYYNRFLWVEPSGRSHTYDKRHLFRMADEHDHYQSGAKNIIIEYMGWRIRPQICYDLRFPVWSRNNLLDDLYDYDLLLYVANWPEARINAWDNLLKARAIENHSFAIGVNRIGKDGAGIMYNGHSAIYDYKGNEIIMMHDGTTVAQTKLNKKSLNEYRKLFPAQLDADSYQINF